VDGRHHRGRERLFLGEKTRKWIHWVEAEAGDKREEDRRVDKEGECLESNRLLEPEPGSSDARAFAEVVEVPIKAAVDVTETFDCRERAKEEESALLQRGMRSIESERTAVGSSSARNLRTIDST